MPFKLFLLCSFVLLARPQDVLPFLQPMRPALVLIVFAMAALVFGDHPRRLAAALSTGEAKRYVLFFALMIFGIPFAYHRGLAFEGVLLGYTANVFFFVLLVSQVTSLQRLKSLVWIICLSTLTYSVSAGVLQGGTLGDDRLQALGGVFDPNDTAYVLLSLFPLCLYFIKFDDGSMKRLLALMALCGAIAAILLTGSRGGMLGLGVVLLLLLLTKTGGIGKRYKIFIALALVSTWFLMRDKIDIGRYLTLADISSDYNVSESGGRLALWKEAIDLIVENPITGVGVDSFATAIHESRLLRGAAYFRWHAVHNSFLQIAAEVGLIGFAIFVLICARSFLTFLRLSRLPLQSPSLESHQISALSGLMVLGFSGLLVAGFFLSQGYSSFFTLYFALAAAMARLQRTPSAVVEATRGTVDSTDASETAIPGEIGGRS
jgi:O-antigen ligase